MLGLITIDGCCWRPSPQAAWRWLRAPRHSRGCGSAPIPRPDSSTHLCKHLVTSFGSWLRPWKVVESSPNPGTQAKARLRVIWFIALAAGPCNHILGCLRAPSEVWPPGPVLLEALGAVECGLGWLQVFKPSTAPPQGLKGKRPLWTLHRGILNADLRCGGSFFAFRFEAFGGWTHLVVLTVLVLSLNYGTVFRVSLCKYQQTPRTPMTTTNQFKRPCYPRPHTRSLCESTCRLI